MVSIADLRRWDVGALDEIHGHLHGDEQRLVEHGEDFRKVMPIDGWQGEAAGAAEAAHRRLVSGLEHRTAGVSILVKTLGQACDAIPPVQDEIERADELARKYGYQVGENGEISDVLTRPGPHDPHPQERARARREVAAMLEEARRTGSDIDRDLASVLNRGIAGEFGTGQEATVAAAAADGAKDPGLTLPPPPVGATAAQNAAWWDSLSPTGQAILLQDHPDWLGNLDGLPATVRDRANRERLPGLIHAARARLKRIENELLQDADGSELGLLRDLPELKDAEEKLRSLRKLESVIGAPGHRQLLVLDTSGRQVKAAVANGNVDTAKHVAVFTPGFTANIHGGLRQYDREMKRLKHASKQLADPNSQIATVTWMGYDAPQVDQAWELLPGGNSVATPFSAMRGGEKLNGFLNGIGAAREVSGRPLHLTALGHSYGSVTTGFALTGNTPVDDAVVFGSPGLGTYEPSDLRVPDGHLYDEVASGDWVPELTHSGDFPPSPLVPNLPPTLGADPHGSPEFQDIATGASTVGRQHFAGSHGHTEYLDAKTTSQHNIAAIVAGKPQLVVH